MSGMGYILNDAMRMTESSRNSSLALAEFRPHGLAGVGAAKDWVTPVSGRTVPVQITGKELRLTVDADIPNHEHLV